MKLIEFKEHVEQFIAYLEIERNMTANTLRAYKTDLHQLVLFWQGLPDKETEIVTPRQVTERFLVSLYYKKIDKTSIARKLSCFQSLAKYLKTQSIILNFSHKRPRLDKKLPVYLTIDEMSHLLDGVRNDELHTRHPIRNKTILELLYATGIRCTELVNIRICDINMAGKTIRIQGKGRKERFVLFGQQAHKRILEYLEKERPFIQNQQEALFLSSRNEKLTSRSIQRVFELFRGYLKIDRHITPHKIRHSFATHMLNRGVDLRVVQELLGHRSLASTERYTHVTLEELSTLCETMHPINNLLNKRKTE